MESEKIMEEYILNYYKKWLNEQKGSIVQQFSKLTKIANLLIISLIVALVALIVMFFLAVLILITFLHIILIGLIYHWGNIILNT